MISYADKLVAENRELEPKQLLTEAFLGLKHICSTKKRIRDTVSLITSAKRYMRKSVHFLKEKFYEEEFSGKDVPINGDSGTEIYRRMLYDSAAYYKYMKSDEWKETRSKLLLELGKRCSMCGDTKTKHFNVHHKSYEYLFKELDGIDTIEILCRRCHFRLHFPNRKLPFYLN